MKKSKSSKQENNPTPSKLKNLKKREFAEDISTL